MAIAFDVATAGGVGVTSFSHTCTGSDLLLFVAVEQGTAHDVTDVQYNSVALTEIDWINNSAPDRSISLWYLINPATGSNTVLINDGTSNGSVASSYTGALQSGVPDASGIANGNTTTPTVTITVVASNSWIVSAGVSNSAISDNGGTVRGSNGSGGQGYLGDSDGTVGTGSQTQDFTQSSNFWGQVTASFAPSIAVTTTSTTTSSSSSTSTTTSATSSSSTTTSATSSSSTTTSATSSSSSTTTSTSTSTTTSATSSSSSTSTTTSNTSSSSTSSTSTSTSTSTSSSTSTTSTSTSTSSSTSSSSTSTSTTTSSSTSTTSTSSTSSSSSSTTTSATSSSSSTTSTTTSTSTSTSSSTSTSTSSTTTPFPFTIPEVEIKDFKPILGFS